MTPQLEQSDYQPLHQDSSKIFDNITVDTTGCVLLSASGVGTEEVDDITMFDDDESVTSDSSVTEEDEESYHPCNTDEEDESELSDSSVDEENNTNGHHKRWVTEMVNRSHEGLKEGCVEVIHDKSKDKEPKKPKVKRAEIAKKVKYVPTEVIYISDSETSNATEYSVMSVSSSEESRVPSQYLPPTTPLPADTANKTPDLTLKLSSTDVNLSPAARHSPMPQTLSSDRNKRQGNDLFARPNSENLSQVQAKIVTEPLATASEIYETSKTPSDSPPTSVLPTPGGDSHAKITRTEASPGIATLSLSTIHQEGVPQTTGNRKSQAALSLLSACHGSRRRCSSKYSAAELFDMWGFDNKGNISLKEYQDKIQYADRKLNDELARINVNIIDLTK